MPPIVHEVLSSPGEPLDPDARTYMEPRFGHDFGRVRVHTGAKAGESARAVNALAYTVGRDVVFAAGRYSTGMREGQRLLAHELTHVVQQVNNPFLQRSPTYANGDRLEREAAASAEAITVDKPLQSLSSSTTTLQRQDAGGDAGADAGQDAGTRDAGVAGIPDAGQESKRKKGGGKVCLTYDDGPEAGTEVVLNVHIARGIPATFFLTGQNMASNPELQKTLVGSMLAKDELFQIGNHTLSHLPEKESEYPKAYEDLSKPDQQKVFRENYENNLQHFRKVLGKESLEFKLARLPGQGRFIEVGGKRIFVIATQGMGMIHVGWDFEFGTNNKSGIPIMAHLKAVNWRRIKQVAADHAGLPRPNDIVLLHDRHWSRKRALLEAILDELTKEGFTFGKLDESGKCS